MNNKRTKMKSIEVSTDEPSLFTPERRQQIIRILEEEQRVTVIDLSQHFAVSEVTIRKDLAWLEAQGLAMRTHGGAILTAAEVGSGELGFDLRVRLRRVEKERIGEAAARYVQDGETIALDASTTALAMVPYLRSKRELTVVTNGMRTAMGLIEMPGVSVLMVGGMLRQESFSLVGKWGRSVLEQVHISKAFVGARGITAREGLTDANGEEVELKREMVEVAKEVIGVIDASKWDQVALATFCRFERLTRIITDGQAPAELVKRIGELGIEIILV